jgi:hypothetical protein
MGISKLISKIGWKGVEWINLVQNRDQWWDLVDTVINLHGEFLD